jgi:hypothetical protein
MRCGPLQIVQSFLSMGELVVEEIGFEPYPVCPEHSPKKNAEGDEQGEKHASEGFRGLFLAEEDLSGGVHSVPFSAVTG